MATVIFPLLTGGLNVFGQPPLDTRSVENKAVPFFTNHASYTRSKEKIPIDSVAKGKTAQGFRPIAEPEIMDLGFTDDFYWFKFSVRNTEATERRFFLVLGNPNIREAELFRMDDKGLQSFGKTGNSIPFVKRPCVSNFYTYSLDAAPGTVTTYCLFLDNRWQAGIFSLQWYSEKKFKRLQDQIYFSYGILVGIVLLTLLINLAQFLFLRERLHLIYSFYALSAILVLLTLPRLDAQFLFPRTSTWNQISWVTSACLYLFLQLKVMRAFLDQTPRTSKYYTLVEVVLWFCLALPVVNFFITFHSFSPAAKQVNWLLFLLLIATGLASIVLSCIEKIRQRYKPALFYLASVSAPMMGGSLMVFYVSDLKPHDLRPLTWVSWQPSFLDIGLGVEAILICMGILYRYYYYKKEKDRLAIALGKEKAASAEQVLLAQEEERKRIAEDLHDELGGNLAALKMTLQSYKLPEENLDPLLRLIDNASKNARTISHNLMPPEFSETNLEDLLRRYFQRLNREGTTRFTFHWSGVRHPFEQHKELMLYRIVLELTNNIAKHAAAGEATVQIVYNHRYLEMIVEDDGKGFSPVAPDEGIGLRNIRSRVNYLSGKMNLDSGIRGTTVIIQVPYQTS